MGTAAASMKLLVVGSLCLVALALAEPEPYRRGNGGYGGHKGGYRGKREAEALADPEPSRKGYGGYGGYSKGGYGGGYGGHKGRYRGKREAEALADLQPL